MILKLIVILIILSPVFNGITYLFVSNHPEPPYSDLAKYKKITDDYKYKNKQAGIVYITVGGIIGLFFTMICFLFHFFETLPIFTVVFASILISFLVEQILCDTLLQVRFTMDHYDQENEEKKE